MDLRACISSKIKSVFVRLLLNAQPGNQNKVLYTTPVFVLGQERLLRRFIFTDIAFREIHVYIFFSVIQVVVPPY